MTRVIPKPIVSRGRVLMCTEAELAEKVRSMGGEKICTVASVSPESKPECAMVGFAINPDGQLILHTHKFSRKWENLSRNPSIALTIFHGVYAPYVQIEGIAKLCDDDEKRRNAEQIYTAEHPKAVPLATFTSGIILVSAKWARFYEWPRKSGDCTEWLVDSEATRQRSRLVVRNACEEDQGRIWSFAERMNVEAPARLPNFALLAEESGVVVGYLGVTQVPSLGLAITGLNVAPSHQRSAGPALVKVARQAIHDHRCCAIVRPMDRLMFEQAGFSELPASRRTAPVKRLMSGLRSSSSSVALVVNWRTASSGRKQKS